MAKQQKEIQLSIVYQNIQKSISNTQAVLESGKQEHMDILFVAEGWAGKTGGQDFTPQNPTFDLITKVVEGKMVGYCNGDSDVTITALLMNHAVESEFPAPVLYWPMFLSISVTLLVEISLSYVLLAYSLWYFVIYFGNAL